MSKAKMSNLKYIGSFPGIAAEGFIYTVTSIEIEEGKEIPRKTRCWGWLPTEKEARHAVSINAGDMMETTYTHVVIEKQPAGILIIPEVVVWYKWTGQYPKGAWKQCKAPKWSEGTVGWGMG
jgi:hypothetical protein